MSVRAGDLRNPFGHALRQTLFPCFDLGIEPKGLMGRPAHRLARLMAALTMHLEPEGGPLRSPEPVEQVLDVQFRRTC